MMVDDRDDTFASTEIACCWGYIGRTIGRLIAMVEDLPDAILDWRPPAPETNSIFALAVHTMANTHENLAGTLCGKPIPRDHRAEFSATTASREAMLARWQQQRHEIAQALSVLPSAALDTPIDHPRRGAVLGLDILLIVARHTAEHLGQAELTRDLALAAQGPCHPRSCDQPLP